MFRCYQHVAFLNDMLQSLILLSPVVEGNFDLNFTQLAFNADLSANSFIYSRWLVLYRWAP